MAAESRHVWCAVTAGRGDHDISSAMEGGTASVWSGVVDEITLDKGRVVQTNFNDYRMRRINECRASAS